MAGGAPLFCLGFYLFVRFLRQDAARRARLAGAFGILSTLEFFAKLQHCFAELQISKPRLRQAENIRLVRQRRKTANQQLGFTNGSPRSRTSRAFALDNARST